LVAAAQKLYNITAVPSYKLSNAKTILSFGADFLASWGTNLELSSGWANSRDPNHPANGGELSMTYTVGPRIGMTASNTDKHISVVPGSETGLALAIAKKLAVATKNAKVQSLLSKVDDAAAIKASGAKESLVKEVIAALQKGHAVALPGDTEAGSNQTDIVVATYLINEMVGDLQGKHPTVIFGEDNVDGLHSAKEVLRILDDAATGKIDVLFISSPQSGYKTTKIPTA